MYEIYTDGAVSRNGHEKSVGAFAWTLSKNNVHLKEDSGRVVPATNNICEMKAILSACQYVETIMDCFDSVSIHSDSAYCIRCCNEKWYKKWLVSDWRNASKKPVKNKEIWEQLIPFFDDPRFTFVKVKGHNGDPKNEYVDYLAKKAKLAYEQEE